MTTSGATMLGAVMVLAGIGIPVMAALNAGLGARMESPVLAAAVLFALALACTLVVLFLQGDPLPEHWLDAPPLLYSGGLFVAFYVLSITWIAPKIGVGNAIMMVLVGQLLAAATIDHFGLLGANTVPLSFARTAGIAMMIVGVVLAQGFR